VSRLEENVLKICLYESVDLREATPATPAAYKVPTAAAVAATRGFLPARGFCERRLSFPTVQYQSVIGTIVYFAAR